MIYYSDFETSTKLIDNKVNVYLWGLVSQDNSIREWNVNLDTFFEKISNLNEPPIIYFHNISWDGSFIVHWLIDNGYEFVEKLNSKSKTKTFTWIADYNTNIYNIKVKFKKYIATFLDSYKILVSSVDKLGKTLNLQKLEIDYEKYSYFKSKQEVPKNLVEYLFRDIDIVKNFMARFEAKVHKLKTTIASTMYYEFQKFYGIHNFTKDFGSPVGKYNVLTREQWIKVKYSYNGGFTAFSPRFEGVDIKNINGHSYDWNSMYPSIMMNYKMPYGSPTTFKVNDEDLELLEVRIFQAIKIDELMPAMMPNGNLSLYLGKYLDKCEDITIYIWKEEWQEILRVYKVDYAIVSTLYFRSKFVFKEFIQTIKNEKIMATNGVDRFISKIKQNSLYGKFGQSIERVSKVLVKDETMELKGKRYGEKQQWVEIKKTTYTKTLPYIPIASYITSMARTLLFRAIIDNRLNFIYCDTDSLYLTNQGINLKLDDKEYGYLKLEHKFDRFKVLKLKCYMLNDIDTGLVVKVSGLPIEGQQKLNFDNFYKGNVIENSKLQKTHNIGGYVLNEIDYTL